MQYQDWRRGYRETHRDEFNTWRREQYANDPEYKILAVQRSRLTVACKKAKVGKAGKTNSLIGCPISELREHIESQFQEGMTWENYGEWHVDHILPCTYFDLKCPLQQRLCFGFWNLQPLWAGENRRKYNKLT